MEPNDRGERDATRRDVMPDSALPRSARAVIVALSVAITTVPLASFEYFPAGDLNSHLYNAWLANLAREGALPGLTIAHTATNVLVDGALELLVGRVTARSLSTALLIVTAQAFLWSAFAFCRSLSRRPCWEWLPLLACLSIGWTFHYGFTNWYVSAAVSLFAAALIAQMPRPRAGGRILGALALWVIAALANPLPVAWSIAAVLLSVTIPRVRRPGRILWAALALLAACGACAVAMGRARFTLGKLLALTGADQLWVFQARYAVFVLAVIALWAVCGYRWLREAGDAAVAHPALAIAVFTSASCLLLPDIAWFPGYVVGASLLTQRASLLAAVAWTAVAALGVRPAAAARAAATISGIAMTWVVTMGFDWAGISAAGASLSAAVATLPPGARVVSVVATYPSRVPPFIHMVERTCIGRCFVWGNYEAASQQFRLRAAPDNAFVVWRHQDYSAIEGGTYIVPALPFPLWKVHRCDDAGALSACASETRRGELLRLDCADPFWHPLGGTNPECPILRPTTG